MGKRNFDVTLAEMGSSATNALDCLMSLDQGVGTATRDVRVVWAYDPGVSNRHFDIYAKHASDVNTVANRSAHSITTAGTVTGVVRVNYEDTMSIDNLIDCIKAIREELIMRGMNGLAAGVLGGPIAKTPQGFDNIIKGLTHGLECVIARGRAEGHVAANG